MKHRALLAQKEGSVCLKQEAILFMEPRAYEKWKLLEALMSQVLTNAGFIIRCRLYLKEAGLSTPL